LIEITKQENLITIDEPIQVDESMI